MSKRGDCALFFMKRPAQNGFVQHPLHIWFVTLGCLRDASGTFLALL